MEVWRTCYTVQAWVVQSPGRCSFEVGESEVLVWGGEGVPSSLPPILSLYYRHECQSIKHSLTIASVYNLQYIPPW